MIEKGVFTEEELLGIMDLAEEETKRKGEGESSSVIQRRPILWEANGGQE